MYLQTSSHGTGYGKVNKLAEHVHPSYPADEGRMERKEEGRGSILRGIESKPTASRH